jgi:hypothetical protein
VISGKEQEWLELEAAACGYEEKLLPPFFNTLSQQGQDTAAAIRRGDDDRCRIGKISAVQRHNLTMGGLY